MSEMRSSRKVFLDISLNIRIRQSELQSTSKAQLKRAWEPDFTHAKCLIRDRYWTWTRKQPTSKSRVGDGTNVNYWIRKGFAGLGEEGNHIR